MARGMQKAVFVEHQPSGHRGPCRNPATRSCCGAGSQGAHLAEAGKSVSPRAGLAERGQSSLADSRQCGFQTCLSHRDYVQVPTHAGPVLGG